MTGAVDIGGTKTAVALVSDTGEVMQSTEWPTACSPPNETARTIAATLLRFMEGSSAALSGVGIACTGPVDPYTGVVGKVDLLPGWQGFNLVDTLASALGLSVAVENDADAAALAEAEWGAGAGASRFVYVTISTGIGAGLIIDGQLYRGVAGSHPEFGHQTLDPSGPQCYCGASGCWEVLASGPAMARWASENWPKEQPRPGAALDAEALCHLARQGHSFAAEVVRREARWIGIGLANLVNLLCPDVVVLGGGVMASADLLLGTVQDIVHDRCGLVPHDRVVIRPAALGRNAALIGAARVWQARYEKRSAFSAG